jgi:hypothetical protein
MSDGTTTGPPTVVLVHGAFAAGSSSKGVIERLLLQEAPEAFAEAILEVGGES